MNKMTFPSSQCKYTKQQRGRQGQDIDALILDFPSIQNVNVLQHIVKYPTINVPSPLYWAKPRDASTTDNYSKKNSHFTPYSLLLIFYSNFFIFQVSS